MAVDGHSSTRGDEARLPEGVRKGLSLLRIRAREMPQPRRGPSLVKRREIPAVIDVGVSEGSQLPSMPGRAQTACDVLGPYGGVTSHVAPAVT